MSAHAVTAGLIVEDVLSRYPRAAWIFLGHQMACPGCAMSCFETVAETASVYGVDLRQLLRELNAAAGSGSEEKR